MELTPKVFRDVQFREKLRGGYHPEDVDEFLEQAALGAEALQERLRQLTDRAQRAEQAANDATGTDEALKRMLLMAQKTADQAVREAREESERALSEAKRQAALIVADAEERGRRTYEGAIADGRERMADLERAVARRQQEVEALQSWVEVEKGHLLRVLRDAEESVAKAGLLSEPPDVPAGDIAGGASDQGARGQGDISHGSIDEAPGSDGHNGAPVAPDRAGADGAGVDRQLVEGTSAPGPGVTASDDDTGEVVDIADNPGRHAHSPTPGNPPSAEDALYGTGRRTQDRPGDGDWDPAYLDNIRGQGTGAPERGPSGPATGSEPSPAARTYYPSTGAPRAVEAPASERSGEQPAPTYPKPGAGHSPEDDETLAFDERALDSFFSEQELGDDRGMGRFRRRN